MGRLKLRPKPLRYNGIPNGSGTLDAKENWTAEPEIKDQDDEAYARNF